MFANHGTPVGKLRRLALMVCVMGGLNACADDPVRVLHALENSELDLMEFSTETVAVQYQDEDGFPIAGGSVLFEVESGGKGASLDPLVVTTDSQGKAETELSVENEAEFDIRVRAEYAEDIRIPVVVSEANGGTLEVEILNRSTAELTSAKVILAKPLSCAVFDPLLPPSPTTQASSASKTITIDGDSKEEVIFKGLDVGAKFTVVAIGKADDQVAAADCADGLEMTQELLDRDTPLTQTLSLQDVESNPAGNRLLLETEFTSNIRLDRVGALFNNMSDEGSDPLKFFVESFIDYDSTLGQYLSAWKFSFVQYLSDKIAQDPQHRVKLQQVATKCKSVKNIKFYTMLSFPDSVTKNEPFEADHEVKYVDAEMLGGTERFVFNSSMRIMGSKATPVITEAKATMELDGALRLTIDKHTLSLPLIDAFLGQILLDTFGKSDLAEILRPMVPCPQLGLLAKEYYLETIDPESFYIANAVQGAMTETCEVFTDDLPQEIYDQMLDDIQSTGIKETLDLEGSCNLEYKNDGTTISQATDGKWIGIGTFTGERP